MEPTSSHRSDGAAWLWLGPLLLAFAFGFYYMARYGGAWAENDSAVFADVIRAFVAGGRLVPPDGEIYANGYTFTAISAFIVNLAGVDVVTLQQVVYPLLSVVVVLPAWLLYRELTGSARGAALGTVLLLIQPEFLFVVVRSSHEKFTRALMLFCLFLLFRSFALRQSARHVTVSIVVFYVTAFALAASNNLLANSFFLAIASALGLGLLMEPFAQRILGRPPALQEGPAVLLGRLFTTALTCVILVYVITFYIYAPATYSFTALRALGNDSAQVVLHANDETTVINNAYSVVGSSWVSLPVYMVLSSANWIMLGASLVIWVGLAWRWLRRGDVLHSYTDRLLFLLYAAFLIQGALAVVADTSGTLGGNLQLRLFPSISALAVGLVASALCRWRPRRGLRLKRRALAAAGMTLALLAALKASNEPSLSNMWFFYRPYEVRALTWSDEHLRNAEVWTEFSERLTSTLLLLGHESVGRNTFLAFNPQPTTRVFLISTISRMRSSRTRNPLPVGADGLRVFDNGDAQIYRLRSRTPYQP